MEIMMLGQRPEYTQPVVDWLNDAFGSEKSRPFYEGIVTHSLEADKLPITFIAVEGETLLATVGIWRGDLLSRQDLCPWLSALVVNEQYRGRGIGRTLQNYVLAYAKTHRWKEIYLYADFTGYYEKNGWEPFDTGYEYMGDKIFLYRHTL